MTIILVLCASFLNFGTESAAKLEPPLIVWHIRIF